MNSTPQTGIPSELTPAEAFELSQQGVPVFDIRAGHERALGCVDGATPFSAAQDGEVPQGLAKDADFILCCTTGMRSAEVVDALRQAGYTRVTGIAGGFRQWQAEGLPAQYADGLDATSADRYARHLALAPLGVKGQQKIRSAGVLLIGAGGLGSPAALYLCAAGIGRLGLVDDDQVERSNLQRQVLHADDTVGMSKIDSARQRLQALNPDVRIVGMANRLDETNAMDLVEGWDLVLDGSDNVATRYAVNDACVAHGIPMVFGAAAGFEGQAGVLYPAASPGRNPCHRCLFPEPAEGAADCVSGGVLGVVPGLVGLIQATEAIKVIAGIGQPLFNRLLLCDALGMEFRSLRVQARPDCATCGRPEVIGAT